MALSHEIISQFAKIVNSDKKQTTETTLYGTIVDEHGHKPGDKDENGNEYFIGTNGCKYIKPDGSDQLIPLTDDNEDPAKVLENSVANINYGDRASVSLKNHTATVTGNISSPSASNKDVADIADQKIADYNIVIAKQLQADKAYIQNLIADKASVGQLEAAEAKITELEADKASIEELNASKAEITNLKATKIDADVVEATYATIENLKATDAKVGSLDADIADINTLMFDSATGTVFHTTFANAVIAALGDAQIKSAMIESLNASQISAGSINTNNINIESYGEDGKPDGKLVISDNTIQISDDNRVRVQIGKDASNDYSISIWDAYGNLMFSEGGITDAAIKEAIIRNDMVSDEANIDAKKLNIDSLFTELNDDDTPTLKSTKVYFDSQQQTLEVAFTEQGKTIEAQGTDISAIQGKINSKIWQQDIDVSIDNLEIGGRNLLRYTSNLPITYNLETGIGSYGTTKPLTDTGDGIRFDVPEDGSGGISIPLIFDGAIQNGEIVTISFDYRGTLTDTGKFYFLQRTSPNVSVNTFPDLIVSEEEWQHYTYTFSSNNANVRTCYAALLFFMDDTEAGKWIEIKKSSLKLERGEKATDWTPAPEDVNAGMANLTTKYSELEQTIDGFKTEVSETYSTKDDLKNLKIGGRNLIIDSDKEQKTDDSSYILPYELSEPLLTGITYTMSLSCSPATSLNHIVVYAFNINDALCTLRPVKCNNILSYPYENTTFTSNGVKFTDNGDGSITLNGTCTAQTNFYISTNFVFNPDTTYVLSDGDVKTTNPNIVLRYKDGSGTTQRVGVNTPFTWGDEYTFNNITIIAYKDVFYDNVTFKPMINTGSEVLPYEPYVAVTENDGKQTLTSTFTVPNDLSEEELNYQNIALYVYHSSEDVAVHWTKLEYGTIATDWTPAPENSLTEEDLQNLRAEFEEKTSKIEQKADDISISVTSLQNGHDSRISNLEGGQETLRQQVNTKIDSESVNVLINELRTNGVDTINTGMGYRFDKEGLVVNKVDQDGNPVSETNTTITENGMTVNDNATDTAVLTANKDGVDAKNLHATTYLIVGRGSGRSRFEDYGDNRTGCFWIGG